MATLGSRLHAAALSTTRRSGVVTKTTRDGTHVDPRLTLRRDVLCGWRAWRHARSVHASARQSTPAAQPAPQEEDARSHNRTSARSSQLHEDDAKDAAYLERNWKSPRKSQEEQERRKGAANAGTVLRIDSRLSGQSSNAQRQETDEEIYRRHRLDLEERMNARESGKVQATDRRSPATHAARSSPSAPARSDAKPLPTWQSDLLHQHMVTGSSKISEAGGTTSHLNNVSQDLLDSALFNVDGDLSWLSSDMVEAAAESPDLEDDLLREYATSVDIDHQKVLEDLWQAGQNEVDGREIFENQGALTEISQPAKELATEDLPATLAITRPRYLVPPTTAPCQGYGWFESEVVASRFDFSSNTQPQPKRRKKFVKRRVAEHHKLQPGHQWYAEVADYREKFGRLLDIEQEQEHFAARNRIESRTLNDLVRDGYAMANLGGRWSDNLQFGKPCAIFHKVGSSATKDFGWSRLVPGSTVIISRSDPFLDAVKDPAGIDDPYGFMLGSVYRKTRGEMHVVFDQCNFDLESGKWRLDLWITDIVLQRMKAAMTALHQDPAQQDLDDQIVSAELTAAASQATPPIPDGNNAPANPRKVQPEEQILSGTTLRDILLQTSSETDQQQLSDTVIDSEAANAIIPAPTASVFWQDDAIRDWAGRHLVEDHVPIQSKASDPNCTLNRSQKRAIAAMLAYRVSLIQGPPGTGKTRTIVETMRMLKRHWKITPPILVSAYTNAAVDNLAAGLRDKGLNTLRFGVSDRIHDDLKELTMDFHMARHPLMGQVNVCVAQLAKLEGATDAQQTEQRDLLLKRKYGLEQAMFRDILTSVDVICATCVSSASRLLRAIDFPIVFLDEASMATEPASLIPLMKGSTHVAIIGDHKQLPPVIISEKAKKGGLSVSLFERLINQGNVPSVMLDTQYRMHPDISLFSNMAFYGGQLRDGANPAELAPPRTAYLPSDAQGQTRHLGFIDHDFPETVRSKSLANEGDADIVCDIVADLLYSNPTLRGSHIGVIAPYTAQIALIESKLDSDPVRKEAFENLLGPDRAAELANIEVKTVDGFEGREKQVIIFSTVRNNMMGYIGFLVDWRRMNVGLTRAKRALIVVGSARTLLNARSAAKLTQVGAPTGGERFWRQFIRHVQKEDAIIKVSSDP